MEEEDYDYDFSFLKKGSLAQTTIIPTTTPVAVVFNSETHCVACKEPFEVLRHDGCAVVGYMPCKKCCVYCSPFMGTLGPCVGDDCSHWFDESAYKRVVPSTLHSGEVVITNPNCCIYVAPSQMVVTGGDAPSSVIEIQTQAAPPRTREEIEAERFAKFTLMSEQLAQQELERRALPYEDEMKLAKMQSEPPTRGDLMAMRKLLEPLAARVLRRNQQEGRQEHVVPLQCFFDGDTLKCEVHPQREHEIRLMEGKLEAATRRDNGRWWTTFKRVGGVGLRPPEHHIQHKLTEKRCVTDTFTFNDVNIFKLLANKFEKKGDAKTTSPTHNNALVFNLSAEHLRKIFGMADTESKMIIHSITCNAATNTTSQDFVPLFSTYYVDFTKPDAWQSRYWHTPLGCNYTTYHFQESKAIVPEKYNLLLPAGESMSHCDIVLFKQRLHESCCMRALKRWASVPLHREWRDSVQDFKDAKSTRNLATIKISTPKDTISAPSAVVYMIAKELPGGVLDKILPDVSFNPISTTTIPPPTTDMPQEFREAREQRFNQWKRLMANVYPHKDEYFLVVDKENTKQQLQLLWDKVSPHTRTMDITHGLQTNLFFARNQNAESFYKDLQAYANNPSAVRTPELDRCFQSAKVSFSLTFEFQVLAKDTEPF